MLSGEGSFLLELLYYAGWRVHVRDGRPLRICALRDGVEIDVTGSSLTQAAGTVFARAMRSGRRDGGAGKRRVVDELGSAASRGSGAGELTPRPRRRPRTH